MLILTKHQTTYFLTPLAACRRESKPPFFLPPGPLSWHTKPSCAPPGGRNGADNQCSAPYFCSLRQTARAYIASIVKIIHVEYTSSSREIPEHCIPETG